MPRLTVEIIADPEEGGFTARVPDIPAYGSPVVRVLEWDLGELPRG